MSAFYFWSCLLSCQAAVRVPSWGQADTHSQPSSTGVNSIQQENMHLSLSGYDRSTERLWFAIEWSASPEQFLAWEDGFRPRSAPASVRSGTKRRKSSMLFLARKINFCVMQPQSYGHYWEYWQAMASHVHGRTCFGGWQEKSFRASEQQQQQRGSVT
jgi:hypothetical protein